MMSHVNDTGDKSAQTLGGAAFSLRATLNDFFKLGKVTMLIAVLALVVLSITGIMVFIATNLSPLFIVLSLLFIIGLSVFLLYRKYITMSQDYMNPVEQRKVSLKERFIYAVFLLPLLIVLTIFAYVIALYTLLFSILGGVLFLVLLSVIVAYVKNYLKYRYAK